MGQTDEAVCRRQFVYQYLQGDGTFMLRLVASNVSDYVCRKIIAELYRVFCQSLIADRIRHEHSSNLTGIEKFQDDEKNKQSDDEDDDDDDDDDDEDDDDESTDQTVYD